MGSTDAQDYRCSARLEHVERTRVELGAVALRTGPNDPAARRHEALTLDQRHERGKTLTIK